MTTSAPKPRLAVVATAAAVLIAGAASWALVNRPDPTPTVGSGAANSAALAAGAMSSTRTLAKPTWRELSRSQQVALKPLQPEWDGMDASRKRRWLELSQRFSSMSKAEQARVHERMRQWMRLSPAQRNLARENYNKTRKLAPGEKAATWESYKQLTPEERRKLANSGQARPQGTPAMPQSPVIEMPVPCPPGAMRRGTSCVLPAAPATAAGPANVPAAVTAAPPAAAAAAPAPVTPPAAPSSASSAPSSAPSSTPSPVPNTSH